MRVRFVAGAFALALLAGLGASGRAEADPAITGYPDSIASLGDSITRAVDSAGFGDFPEYSWSTGTQPSVNPYYSRLLAVHPPISGNRYNDAVSGAQMDDLDGQAQQAVAQGAELVFVLMGANDVCTGTEASMTPVATFQAEFEAAMQTLTSGLPDSRIAVISIPDIYILWEVLHDNGNARLVWAFADICQSLLANPQSTAAPDVQRRANVRQRNMDFNDVLNNVCAQYAHCFWDGYVGFNTPFTPPDISSIDYFHPSVQGQALIAQKAWEIAFDWSDTTPPVSDSSAEAAPGGVSLQMSASDGAGVNGIEYRTGGTWTTYLSPVALPTGTAVTWRAVDVNGNVEATHTCYIGGWGWLSGDADCDGFTNAAETSMNTNANAACGYVAGGATQSGSWPPDLSESDSIDILDALQLKPVFGLSVPSQASPRFDLDTSGAIDILDVLQIKPFFNRTCA